MLGVRILPRQYELFAGYLLRLANVNGLTSIKHLFKVISIEKIKMINHVKWSSVEFSIILPKLAIALDISQEELRKHLDLNAPGFGYNPNDGICNDIRITEPRICIDFIKEGDAIDCRTQLPIFQACQEHNRSYTNSCPACNHPFDWNTLVFDGCRKCGLLWHDFDNTVKRSPSPLETLMWDEILNTTEQTSKKIADIIQTIFAIARPFDTFPDRFYTLPSCSNLNDHIRNAYSILESSSSIKQWEASCFKNRCELSNLGGQAILAPIKKLKSRLTFFNIDSNPEQKCPLISTPSTNIEFIESYDFIRPSRAKILSSSIDNTARYHVTRQQLESYLLLEDNDLLYSVQSRTLHSANGTNVAREQMFNLQVVSDLITHTGLSSLKGVTDIDDHKKAMRMHLCTRGMLINAILLKEVPGKIHLSHQPANIMVEKRSFDKWLSEQFTNTCKKNVSILKAATALCCGIERIKSLVIDGDLHYPAWSPGENEISGESLSSYWLKHHK